MVADGHESIDPDATQRVPDGFDVVVFDYSGVCTPSASEFIATNSPAVAPLRPRLASIITEFRERGSTIVLLSNEFDREWIRLIDDFPEFDHVLVGSDNRVFKPDRRAFQRVLHVTQCEPHRCLVIDDDIDNCRVAESIGCHSVRFDPSDVSTSWTDALSATPPMRAP